MGAATPSTPDKPSRAQIMADELVRNIVPRQDAFFSMPGVDPRRLRYDQDRLTFRTEEYEEARQGIHTADVEASILRYDRMVQISTHFGRGPFGQGSIPVWLDESRQPIAIDLVDFFLEALTVGGGIRYSIVNALSVDTLLRDLSENEAFSRGRVVGVSLAEAKEALRTGLIEFLSVRLEGDVEPEARGSPPPNTDPGLAHATRNAGAKALPVKTAKAVATKRVKQTKTVKAVARSLGAAAATTSGLADSPYLPFTVHTRTSDLDIEQAPAYFLTWTFFGGPSTPRDGYILPGLYRFRGQDSQGNYRYDPKKFKIPPLQYARTIL